MTTIGGRGGTGSTGSGTDHHAGWRKILVGQTVVIEEYKQMVVYGTFENDGTLDVLGDLILED